MNESGNRKLIKKSDLILIALVLFFALLLLFMTRIMHRSPSAVVEVCVDGTVVETLDLSKNQELDIPGASGGNNHLIIKDQTVWVSEATCPDKICIHQGKISMDGEIIVCLPNKMTAQIKSTR